MEKMVGGWAVLALAKIRLDIPSRKMRNIEKEGLSARTLEDEVKRMRSQGKQMWQELCRGDKKFQVER